MLSYSSSRRPSLPSSAAPTKPTRHSRRATALLTIVKDGDNSIFSVGHKLASEFHQIFSAHPRTASEHYIATVPPPDKPKGAGPPPDVLRRTPISIPDSDLDHFFSSPSSYALSHKKSLSLSTPSTSTCATPASKHRALAHSPSAFCYSSTESLGEYIFSSSFEHEEIAPLEHVEDPFFIRSVEPHQDAADRVGLRDASARAAFRLTGQSASANLPVGTETPKKASRRRLSSVTRATSLPSFAQANRQSEQPETPTSASHQTRPVRAGVKRVPLSDVVNMEEEMFTDLQSRRRLSQARPPKKSLRLSQSLAPVTKTYSRRIADIPITPPPVPRLPVQAMSALQPPPVIKTESIAAFRTPERSPSPTLPTSPLSPPRYRQ